MKSQKFKESNAERDKKQLLESLTNKGTYTEISIMYRKFVQHYGKKTCFLLSPKMSAKIKEDRIKMIRKFIEITVNLTIPFEIYMEAQFESLMDWIKKVNPELGYVPFASMITDKAIDRYKRYLKLFMSSPGYQPVYEKFKDVPLLKYKSKPKLKRKKQQRGKEPIKFVKIKPPENVALFVRKKLEKAKKMALEKRYPKLKIKI